jgi:hypothetical protein
MRILGLAPNAFEVRMRRLEARLRRLERSAYGVVLSDEEIDHLEGAA